MTQARLMVQGLKGSKAQVLWAFTFSFLLEGIAAMDEQDVRTWTGLKRETCYGALDGLCSMGLLGKESAKHGRVIYHLGVEMLPLLQEIALLSGKNPQLDSSRSPLSGHLPTTTTVNDINKLIKDSVVVVISQMSEKRTPTQKDMQAALKLERQKQLEEYGIPVAENLAMCKLYGIGEPSASDLSEMKHVTPDFIRDHVKSLGPGETKGLAIIRIRSDEMPRLWLDEIDKELLNQKGLSVGDVLGNFHTLKQAGKSGEFREYLAEDHDNEFFQEPTDEEKS